MPPFDRQLWRAAGHLEHFLTRCIGNRLPEPPNSGVFKRMRVLTDRLRMVEERGWRAAARSVAQQLHNELFRCQAQISTALEIVSSRFAMSDAPTQAELYAELLALADEFEDMEVDEKEGTLSLATESIELEGQYLGSFCIILSFKDEFTSTSPLPYLVKAVAPCCPEGRSDITHPHVMNDHLCEGDATPALRAALQTGRLTDFFQIINQVLHTYNSGSPYASLNEWNGTECQACGTNVSFDTAAGVPTSIID